MMAPLRAEFDTVSTPQIAQSRLLAEEARQQRQRRKVGPYLCVAADGLKRHWPLT
jgi:hypothetical protein